MHDTSDFNAVQSQERIFVLLFFFILIGHYELLNVKLRKYIHNNTLFV
jgi:hypothetical protein